MSITILVFETWLLKCGCQESLLIPLTVPSHDTLTIEPVVHLAGEEALEPGIIDLNNKARVVDSMMRGPRRSHFTSHVCEERDQTFQAGSFARVSLAR